MGTGSLVNCSLYGGLVLGLLWIVGNKKGWYWICAGLKNIGRIGTGSEVNLYMYYTEN